MDMIRKIFINYEQMHGHVLDMIRSITADGWQPDYVVGITRGGLLPAVLISQFMEIPMHTLKVTLRDGAEEDCDHNAWMAEDAYGYASNQDVRANLEARKNILIVDDINDSGATIAWIKQDWMASCLPKDPVWDEIWGSNVRFAVVVNNLASSEIVDYHSMEINKSEDPSWVVFPWEEFWKR